MHIFHKWTKWVLIESTSGWAYNRQWRECSVCGKRQEKYVVNW